MVEHKAAADAEAGFVFQRIGRPAINDAAAQARFELVAGQRDPNGGALEVLQDGKAAGAEDQPAANFFFNAGTAGGRILVDLGRAVEIKQINSYSWHPRNRGPQVYSLYASTGKASGFNPKPAADTDPEQCGWEPLARVDTRPKTGEYGGQYAVSVGNGDGVLGAWQYLLFVVKRTSDTDHFGHTFFTEIDVIDAHGPALEYAAPPARREGVESYEIEGGKYRFTLDVSETPDLADWARQQIAPMVREWYPKLIQMLPSEGFAPPRRFSIVFSKDMQGVAATSGTRIRCAADWLRKNLKGEAKGAIFHELVHVVQQYGSAPRSANASRPPGWLTEGLTDYLRFYVFEPETKGAEISPRNAARARYDGSYRVTANFLNWASQKYDRELVKKLNAAIREGRYNEDLWKKLTGKTVQELGDEWKAGLVPKTAE